MEYAIYCSSVERDLSSELIHVSLLKQPATCLKGRKEKVLQMRVGSHSWRLMRRLQGCGGVWRSAHTQTQRCKHALKHTKTHTHTHTHKRDTQALQGACRCICQCVFSSSSRPSANRRDNPRPVWRRERHVMLFTCVYSLNPSLSWHVFDERRSLRRTDKYVSVAENVC